MNAAQVKAELETLVDPASDELAELYKGLAADSLLKDVLLAYHEAYNNIRMDANQLGYMEKRITHTVNEKDYAHLATLATEAATAQSKCKSAMAVAKKLSATISKAMD